MQYEVSNTDTPLVEIIRHGWPITRCTVTSTNLATRYCCYTQCRSGCKDAASGAPKCGSLVDQINRGSGGDVGWGGYGPPEECARNSTACPTSRGEMNCDDG